MFLLLVSCALAAAAAAEPGRLLLYGNGRAVQGNFGDRAAATAICRAAAPTEACSAVFALLSYTGDPAVGLFADDGSKVVGRAGLVAANWTMLWSGGILKSLQSAGVLEVSKLWFSGTEANGQASGYNCAEWTRNETAAGRAGRFQAVDGFWVSAGQLVCSYASQIVCACALPPTASPTRSPSETPSGSPTFSPSEAPSEAPSASPTPPTPVPTTGVPTPAGAYIALFIGGPYVPADFLLPPSTATSVCATQAPASCEGPSVSAVFCTPSLDMEGIVTDLGYSPTLEVRADSPTYPLIAPSVPSFMSTGSPSPLESYGLVAANGYWTGCTATGTYDAGLACDNWTSLAPPAGSFGTTNNPGGEVWMTSLTACDNNAIGVLCMCVYASPSASPTAVPSASPTAVPSASPTTSQPSTSPTASPSEAPTASPSQATHYVVYGTRDTFQSDFLAGTTVEAVAATYCPTPEAYAVAGCDAATLLVCLSDRNATTQVPVDLGLPPDLPVFSTHGFLVARTWPEFFTTDFFNPVANQGIYGGFGNTLFSGCTTSGRGSAAHNCADFTFYGPSGEFATYLGIYRYGSQKYNGVYNAGPYLRNPGYVAQYVAPGEYEIVGSCDTTGSLFCVCSSSQALPPTSAPAPTTSSPTFRKFPSPTIQPVAYPTASPTPSAPTPPTLPLTTLAVFPSGAVASGSVLAGSTPLEAAAALCPSSPFYPPLNCTATTLLLCLSTGGARTRVPEDLGVSPAAAVYNSKNRKVVDNWLQVFNYEVFQRFLQPQPGYSDVYTGCDGNGDFISLQRNCNDFTAGGGTEYYGAVGEFATHAGNKYVAATYGRFSGSEYELVPSIVGCASTSYFYCVCARDSSSPTTSPTPEPTPE